MDEILDWFEWIGDIIESVFDFFTSFLENLVSLFSYIKLALNFAYSFIDSMPTWLSLSCFATITVSVLFMMVGRSTGGKKQ